MSDLIEQVGIPELTPETIVSKLDRQFLEKQSDEWITQLYKFLGRHTSLLRRLKHLPLVRLTSGSHVTPFTSTGAPQAFLPTSFATDFPTVSASVSTDQEAKAFLVGLGLTEPDLVDDVIRNLIPRYSDSSVRAPPPGYAQDIAKLLTAFDTDSQKRKKLLVQALSGANFIVARDANTGRHFMAQPNQVYVPTEKLTSLFEGIEGVLFADHTVDCLRGEKIRELLEACGARRYLAKVQVSNRFSSRQLAEMRRASGFANSTGGDTVEDYSVRGLEELIRLIPSMGVELRKARAQNLWEALCDAEERFKHSFFTGTYSWIYYKDRQVVFDAAFVITLNEAAWVPGLKDQTVTPREALFADLHWRENPFLLTKIQFKPPIVEMLAREAGFEPAMLELLRRVGLTNEADLRARLGLGEGDSASNPSPLALLPATQSGSENRSPSGASAAVVDNEGGASHLVGDDEGSTVPNARSSMSSTGSRHERGVSRDRDVASVPPAVPAHEAHPHCYSGAHYGHAVTNGAVNSQSSRRFISYVTASPDEELDPDSLTHEARMALESQAIVFIRSLEPNLQEAPLNNPGFDLSEIDAEGRVQRWVEVKAMTTSLAQRPVALSRVQFDCALRKRNDYWLYIVEFADNLERRRLLRICDPAGLAQSFSFDEGWLAVAEVVTSE